MRRCLGGFFATTHYVTAGMPNATSVFIEAIREIEIRFRVSLPELTDPGSLATSAAPRTHVSAGQCAFAALQGKVEE
jgi:hypothetical protein